MSFINLLGNDVWSEADIKTRLHAEIRSEVSEFAETELNRALQGAALGLHQLTLVEQQSLMRFKYATDRVASLGTQARLDSVLLDTVLALEVALQRLTLSLPDNADTDALVLDAQARLDAQALLAAASPEALALLALRNPPAQEVLS